MYRFLTRAIGIGCFIVAAGVFVWGMSNLLFRADDPRTVQVALPDTAAGVQSTSNVYFDGASVGEVHSVKPLVHESPPLRDRVFRTYLTLWDRHNQQQNTKVSDSDTPPPFQLLPHQRIEQLAAQADTPQANQMVLATLELYHGTIPINTSTVADVEAGYFTGRAYLNLHTPYPKASGFPPDHIFIPTYNRRRKSEEIIHQSTQIISGIRSCLTFHHVLNAWYLQKNTVGQKTGRQFLEDLPASWRQHQEGIRSLYVGLDDVERIFDQQHQVMTRAENGLQQGWKELGRDGKIDAEIRRVAQQSRDFSRNTVSELKVRETLKKIQDHIQTMNRSLDGR